jgi:hypothetical protein
MTPPSLLAAETPRERARLASTLSDQAQRTGLGFDLGHDSSLCSTAIADIGRRPHQRAGFY